MGINSTNQSVWPKLAFEEWKDTLATLHMWTQIVGKIRLVQSPLVNHWWNVTFLVTPRGLTTGSIPYLSRSFQIDFDFIEHQLVILTDDGTERKIALRSQSVADFYNELMSELNSLGLAIKIYATPVEIPDPIPFPKDDVHATYQAEHAETFWRILLSVDRVFKEFRSRFIGKSSPVHFFWGSFDIAVTRFSGRRAPERVGADHVTREAYSHEASSAGFWPGSGEITGPAFYSYMAPAPPGLEKQPIRPSSAFCSTQLSEFLLMYDDVRQAPSPRQAVLEFLQ